MNILGIHWGEHDSAACLLQDGRVAAAAEEERFNRLKHAPFAYPLAAARYCLKAGGISPGEVDLVAYAFRLGEGLGRSAAYILPRLRRAGFILAAEAVRRTWYYAIPAYTRYVLKVPARTRFLAVPHHLAHAASAFFASPFEQAAILVVDGVGEWAATSLYAGVGNRVEPLEAVYFPHSLGFYYAAFTEYLGFEPFDGEYKVMGLAAYGEPVEAGAFREIVRLPERGPQYRLDLGLFNFQHSFGRTTWYGPGMERRFGLPASQAEMPSPRACDLAASVQDRLEAAYLHLAAGLRQRTGLRDLCLAGGVALNSVANGKLVRRGIFERVFIQPASHDAGSALGAALYAWAHPGAGLASPGGARPEPVEHVYLGPEFSSAEIEAHLRSSRLPYRSLDDPAGTAARLVADGRITGWFQGRMEFGPRALGARSILADPRRPEMKDRLNAAVKFREPFRPFAPSVPAGRSAEFFEDLGASPYMLLVVKVRQDQVARLPAITHVDGTARLHTVTCESQPRYYDFLTKLGELTGVPVVLNTSFNVRGEPIVCSPKEAIATYMNSGLDVLVIDRFLLEKEGG